LISFIIFKLLQLIITNTLKGRNALDFGGALPYQDPWQKGSLLHGIYPNL
jgi:hypothetical protein